MENRKNKRYLERREAACRKMERGDVVWKEKQCNNERRVLPSSLSQYEDNYKEREIEHRLEDEREKQKRLEDWYRDYVTIDVDLEYFCRDNEYNQEDYWDYRNHEIRVTRREAMALIEAGESAIISKLGYSQSLTRIIRFQIPYGLYDRPWGC